MKNPLIIGNWKLNGNINTINNLLINFKEKLNNIPEYINIAIAPPILYLDRVKNYLFNNNINIQLCAQNVDIHLSGAFTGDVSANMLKDLGVKYVLIGHSERREYHKENDLYIAKKFDILKKTELIPILCIGENKIEHDAGFTKSVCINKIDTIIKLFGIQSLKNTIIAYEPIWAIGSGISESPENVQIVHKSIRNHIAKYDVDVANQILMQYGGSVNLHNINNFIIKKDIDGVLIGSASLLASNFISIIQSVENTLQNYL